ncbi:MAG: PilZ domain-containing protein [Acetobacterales bacterium]
MRKLVKMLFGWDGEERREHPRFPGREARTAACIRIGDTEYAMRDFSLSGFCIADYEGALIEGESFAFTFVLPDGSEVPCVGTVSRLENATLAARYLRPVPELLGRLEPHMPSAA